MLKSIAYKILFCTALIGMCYTTQAQSDCPDSTQFRNIYSKEVRSVFAFWPSRARVINGWAFGAFVTSEHCVVMDSVRLNGLHTNIGPIQVMIVGMTVCMAVPVLLGRIFKKNEFKDTVTNIHYEPPVIHIKHKINGVSLGLFDVGPEFSVQGFQANLIVQSFGRLNGFSVAGLVNVYEQFNGIMISGVMNHSTEGRGFQLAPFNYSGELKGIQIGVVNFSRQTGGLQIGLVNLSKKLTGIQIGLWNHNGKHGFPIINFRFR